MPCVVYHLSFSNTACVDLEDEASDTHSPPPPAGIPEHVVCPKRLRGVGPLQQGERGPHLAGTSSQQELSSNTPAEDERLKVVKHLGGRCLQDDAAGTLLGRFSYDSAHGPSVTPRQYFKVADPAADPSVCLVFAAIRCFFAPAPAPAPSSCRACMGSSRECVVAATLTNRLRRRVRIELLANHGASYTCIYSVGIHGRPGLLGS